MNKEDIISSLKNYIKENPKLVFYKECLEHLKNLDNKILKIPRKNYYLESLKIHICYNINKYNLYIYDKIKKNNTYIKYKVTQDIFDKLIYQLITVKEHNSILGLADKSMKIPNFNFKKVNNKIVFYLIISEKKLKFQNKYFQLGNLYESINYLLGINIFEVLKYQRLDRIVDFINKGGESLKIYKLIDDYLKLLQKFDWKLRERILVHSGVIYQALGTTYTRDIDLLVLQEDKNKNDANIIINKFKSLDADPSILVENNTWITKDNKVLKYKSNWFNYLLPSLAGARDIFETMSNPQYYFTFMGIKFISLDMNIKRFLQRSNTNTYVDLIMMEELNNYKLGERLCIPNMTIRQGRLVVFTEKEIDKMHHQIKERLREYYHKNLDLDTIRKKIKKCIVQSYEIYKGPVIKDTDTGLIKAFHLSIKENIYNKYAKNANYLLDIGSGQLTDLRFWEANNIKNVYGIEPSIESIKKAYNRLEEYGTKININIIHSIGNIDWVTDTKFLNLLDNKFDIITFQYTIHYMLNSLELMIKNIKLVMKKNTKIIITCMDGNKIHENFMKYGKIEIRNDQEPIFAIVPMYDYKNISNFNGNDILVYFKGAYGVANGSVEPIIDINYLINTFEKYHIKLLEKKNFIDYQLPLKNKMSYIQKQVSSYYMSLIFENL